MKLKAFIEKLKKDTGSTIPEFDAAIAAVPDVEIDDKVVAEYESKLYTADRAANDAGIAGKIATKAKSEVWDRFDGMIKAYEPFLDAEAYKEVASAQKTFDRMEKLQDAVKATLDKAKAAGQQAPPELKALQKQIQDMDKKYHDDIKAKESEWQKKYEAQEQNLKGVNLDFILKNKIFKHQFAKEFETMRDQIANFLIQDLKKAHLLSLTNDSDVLVQYDENGTVRDRYDGNNKVTVDSLIEKGVAQFIKKNNAGDQSDSGGNQKFSDHRTNAKPEDTLADRRRAGRTTNSTSTVFRGR